MQYCEEFAALLDPYIDGELSQEDAARVEAHLQVCDACRAYVQDALAIREAFPQDADIQVPEGFAEGVMAAIRAGAAPRKRWRPMWQKTLLPLAACCAVVILAVTGLPRPASNVADVASADVTDGAPVQEETAPGGQIAENGLESETKMDSSSPAEETEEGQTAADSAPATTSAPATDMETWQYTAQEGRTVTAESGEEDTAEPAENCIEPASGDRGDPTAENSSEQSAEDSEDLTSDEDTLSINPAGIETEPAEPEAWVDHDNVDFAFTAFLTAEEAGDALDGYEGKPYSDAERLEEGVLGTGYAMTAEEAAYILHDVLNLPRDPAEDQLAADALCCIVVTGTGEAE